MMKDECRDADFKAAQNKVDNYFKTITWKKLEAQGFAINRANINQVFTENQMYIRKFPNNAATYLNKIDYRKYGLDPYTKCIAKAESSVTPYTGDATEWFSARAKEGKVTLKDFNDRDVAMTKETFNYHTTGSHEARVKYLQSISEVMLNPDEIWLNAEHSKKIYNNYSFVKYYNDDILVICCKVINGQQFQISTWYPIAKKKETISRVRRGLLIHKKTSR